MIHTCTYRDTTWIDLDSPTPEEVAIVLKQYRINNIVGQELLLPTPKPKVDLYREYIYTVLHFPAIRHSHVLHTAQEIDFVVGKEFIITTHYDTIDPLYEFSKIFEVNSITDRSDMGDHAGFIFYYMLKNIYRGVGHELDSIKERLSEIENKIFSGKETKMVEEISKVSRDIINIRSALRPHDQILDSLEVATIKLFGKDFEYPMRNLKNEQFRIGTDLSSHQELLSELRETNNSLVSTKQNETMKELAVIAFIALPLGLFIALLQVETVSRPIVGHPGDFWAILLMIIALAGLLYSYSKGKKWL